jgi:hypothetical protein
MEKDRDDYAKGLTENLEIDEKIVLTPKERMTGVM